MSQDENLTERIRQGDLEAFSELFHRYTVPLRQFAASSVPIDVAEDIVQEVFLDLWHRREIIEVEDATFAKFLFGATRKKTLQYHRNEAARSRILNEQDLIPAMSTVESRADEYVLQAEFNAVYVASIKTLSEIQRSVLSLRWGTGMSYADIAECLEISENAAMLHASRIKKILKPILQKYLRGIV